MSDALVRAFGWRAALMHGDPTSFDRWNWLRKHLRTGGGRTLDAGCGSGTFTLYAASVGNEALGISHADQAKAERRARICGLPNARFMQHDLRKLDELVGKIGPFDQIMCFECLEHIRDDRSVVQNLAAMLKPGGRIMITVPYKYYRHLIGDVLSETEDGGHVRWGYTHDEMSEILDTGGLRTIEKDYVSGVLAQQISNAQRVIARAPGVGGLGAWALTFPLRPMVAFDRLLTGAIGYPYLSIGVVAEKSS
jgi:SAM-dependent methyltransferase